MIDQKIARQALARAGFSEEQYRFVSVLNWMSPGAQSRRDSEGEWEVGTASRVRVARKGKDGVWEISINGLSYFWRGGEISSQGCRALARSTLEEMGLSGSQIFRIKEEIEREERGRGNT